MGCQHSGPASTLRERINERSDLFGEGGIGQAGLSQAQGGDDTRIRWLLIRRVNGRIRPAPAQTLSDAGGNGRRRRMPVRCRGWCLSLYALD